MEKKLWFHQVTSRFWLPISWEGWVVMGGMIGVLLAILHFNGILADEPMNSSRAVRVFLEAGALTGAFYWVTHGHVRK